MEPHQEKKKEGGLTTYVIVHCQTLTPNPDFPLPILPSHSYLFEHLRCMYVCRKGARPLLLMAHKCAFAIVQAIMMLLLASSPNMLASE